jgi:hypothetical protein
VNVGLNELKGILVNEVDECMRGTVLLSYSYEIFWKRLECKILGNELLKFRSWRNRIEGRIFKKRMSQSSILLTKDEELPFFYA